MGGGGGWGGGLNRVTGVAIWVNTFTRVTIYYTPGYIVNPRVRARFC